MEAGRFYIAPKVEGPFLKGFGGVALRPTIPPIQVRPGTIQLPQAPALNGVKTLSDVIRVAPGRTENANRPSGVQVQNGRANAVTISSVQDLLHVFNPGVRTSSFISAQSAQTLPAFIDPSGLSASIFLTAAALNIIQRYELTTAQSGAVGNVLERLSSLINGSARAESYKTNEKTNLENEDRLLANVTKIVRQAQDKVHDDDGNLKQDEFTEALEKVSYLIVDEAKVSVKTIHAKPFMDELCTTGEGTQFKAGRLVADAIGSSEGHKGTEVIKANGLTFVVMDKKGNSASPLFEAGFFTSSLKADALFGVLKDGVSFALSPNINLNNANSEKMLGILAGLIGRFGFENGKVMEGFEVKGDFGQGLSMIFKGKTSFDEIKAFLGDRMKEDQNSRLAYLMKMYPTLEKYARATDKYGALIAALMEMLEEIRKKDTKDKKAIAKVKKTLDGMKRSHPLIADYRADLKYANGANTVAKPASNVARQKNMDQEIPTVTMADPETREFGSFKVKVKLTTPPGMRAIEVIFAQELMNAIEKSLSGGEWKDSVFLEINADESRRSFEVSWRVDEKIVNTAQTSKDIGEAVLNYLLGFPGYNFKLISGDMGAFLFVAFSDALDSAKKTGAINLTEDGSTLRFEVLDGARKRPGIEQMPDRISVKDEQSKSSMENIDSRVLDANLAKIRQLLEALLALKKKGNTLAGSQKSDRAKTEESLRVLAEQYEGNLIPGLKKDLIKYFNNRGIATKLKLLRL